MQLGRQIVCDSPRYTAILQRSSRRIIDTYHHIDHLPVHILSNPLSFHDHRNLILRQMTARL